MAVEEIPSGMAPGIARALSERFENRLGELGVGFDKITCFHTPKRFSLVIEGLEPGQKDMVVESFGPSESAAFGPDGSPTKAAMGFARSKGAKVEDLDIAERDKGTFLVFRKKTRSRNSRSIITEETGKIIAGIKCPKSMRWKSESPVFARPIRKISCFYQGKPLRIQTPPGIPFSNTVSGHRFAGGKSFKPESWQRYLNGLRKRFVIADPAERLKAIEKGIAAAVKKLGGVSRHDTELLETVCGLVEYPVVLSGNFEKKFLNLPEEVLTGVMRNHQKYFPVFSSKGTLMPHFVFVCGTPVTDPQTVIRGNERVLRARFTDAEFFRKEDMKKTLEGRTGDLESMVFLSGLGSYADKTERLEKAAAELASQTGKKDLSKKLARAAKLSKTDLSTQMVFEIPELQGVMGRRYAEAEGEGKEVCAAIEEQYMPTARDSVLPETETGALLAIVDKIDNICSCFYLGMKPSGSSDPLALRRQAIGLIRITLERNLDFSIAKLTDFILQSLKKAPYSTAPKSDINEISAEITEFIAGRFRGVMAREAEDDSLEAVISVNFDSITDCRRRLAAIENARKSESFTALAASFKRVVNILKDGAERDVSPELFENRSEEQLWEAVEQIEKSARKSSYEAHLDLMEKLRRPIDNFFDGTMVMHEDSRIRKNRIAMLGRIKDLFLKVGDLSKIEVPKDL